MDSQSVNPHPPDPKPSLLLTIAAALYLLLALPLLFAPDELLAAAGVAPQPLVSALLQLLAAGFFGFALLNGFSRHARFGGIFGRPILFANLAHSFTAAVVLRPLALSGGLPPPFVVALAVHTGLAVAFGWRLFGPTKAER